MQLQRYFRRKRRLFLSGRGKGACRWPGMLLDEGMRNGYKKCIAEGDKNAPESHMETAARAFSAHALSFICANMA